MTVAALASDATPSTCEDMGSSVHVVLGSMLLAAVVFFNESNFREVDVENPAFDWQIGVRLIVCAGCGLYGCMHIARTLPYLTKMPGLLSVLLGGWVLVTVPFGVNPVYSAGAATALWCFILAAPAILLSLGRERFIQVTLLALTFYLIGSWIAYYAAPELSRMHEVDGSIRFGGLNHPNATGRQAALTVAMALVAGFSRAVRWKCLIPVMAFALFTLVLTDSRTAICAALAVLSLVLYRKTDFTTKYIAVYSMIVIGAIWLAYQQPELDAVFSRVSRSGEAEEITTLTGRTDLWDFVLRKVSESPILGYGYGCSRFVIVAEHYWPTHHAHNVILNMLLGTGIPGGLLLLAMFLALIRSAISDPDDFSDFILLLVLVGGMADVVVFSPIPDSHTLLLLAAFAWRFLPLTCFPPLIDNSDRNLPHADSCP
ncbi:MAG: O-antigen ligase family protein [Planctomycetaceae bacterium]|nr:O-antigen ligase family protein [Planctomycetaceae bacterium]